MLLFRAKGKSFLWGRHSLFILSWHFSFRRGDVAQPPHHISLTYRFCFSCQIWTEFGQEVCHSWERQCFDEQCPAKHNRLPPSTLHPHPHSDHTRADDGWSSPSEDTQRKNPEDRKKMNFQSTKRNKDWERLSHPPLSIFLIIL